jgi:predicted nucleic acid-binding protein
MIILDTNVVSEPMRPMGNPAVTAWLDRQVAETLYLTAISLSESLVGIRILPDGKRKDGLEARLKLLLEQLLGPRILGFDRLAAEAYADIFSKARANGQALSVADAQIAAIASVHGFAVATRDAGPFEAAGVSVINPWVG